MKALAHLQFRSDAGSTLQMFGPTCRLSAYQWFGLLQALLKGSYGSIDRLRICCSRFYETRKEQNKRYGKMQQWKDGKQKTNMVEEALSSSSVGF